jgi:hypothetical protein
MISLKEGPKSTILCDLVTKNKRQPVYYVDDVDKARINEVDTRELLGGHMGALQTRLRVNKADMDSAVDLLHDETEPTQEHAAGVHKSYWEVRDLKHQLLTREMDIRDQKNQRFEINFPKKLDVFFGHLAVLGPTGSGKGWWITDLILRMWKSTSYLNRRNVYYISAEASIDKTLDRLRVRKYGDWFFPIDVSYEAGEASGQDMETFWEQKVTHALRDVHNCIVVLDDIMDAYGDSASILRTQNRILRIGRHRNISVISCFHSIRSGPWTRQLTQSAGHLVLFAKAQQGRVRDFFHEVLGMRRSEALQLTKHLQSCGRATVVRTSAPVTLIAEKYLKLI